ncbi:hypothetical protein POM88_001340 [Heracleum sosnowskyi]|uniref:Uncharacterized protein n=1 Tax=Heracleum sosnowskyi TaxID=360622 RepID=A0AAD8JBY3_9APIA|nr:hypothetical protein POM88_001340 [Heracleum sosnowskyi]
MFQQMELAHYGSIKVTDVYILKSSPLVMINGTLRATLNGNSFINPGVPIRLADKFHVQEAYNLDFPYRPMAYGEWTPYSMNSYNKWDVIFRCTTHVFLGGWTTILVLDEILGRYLGFAILNHRN